MGKRRGGYGRCSSFTLAPRLVPIAFFRVLVYKSPRLLYNPHIARIGNRRGAMGNGAEHLAPSLVPLARAEVVR